MNGTTNLPPGPVSLRKMAENLRLAAANYSAAWMAQRMALDAWEQAYKAGVSGTGEGGAPDLAAAFTALTEAAEAAQLLDIDVEDEGLLDLNAGLRQLEAVADAAERLASVLERGVMQ